MRMLGDSDPARAGPVAQAVLQMRKIEVPVLELACERARAAAAG